MALKKFAVNMAALTATRMLQTVSSFLAIPILARLLGPADFGLVAVASTFVAFTLTISDAGLGQTLVRVSPKERDVWSSAFWMISGIGLALALILVVSAPLTAWIMREPRLFAVILVLAPIPLIQASLATATADLQQREQFRHLAFAELLGSLSGTVAAIGLAWAGAGAWALVAQQLAYWVVKGLIILFSTKFWPRFVFSLQALGAHVAFGRDTAILSLVGFFQKNLDPLVIGRMLGTAPVGLYSMGGRLGSLPMQFLSMPLQSALFTRMVMIRDDKAATRDLFLVSAWIVAAVVFPGMGICAAASPAYFGVLLTDKWLPAAPIFMLFAAPLAFQCVMIICGTMLLAIGETGRRLRLNVEFTIAWLIVLPFAAHYNVEVVAAAYGITYGLMSIRSYPMFLAPIGASAGDLFKTLSGPILVTLGGIAVFLGLRTLWPMDPVREIIVNVCVLLMSYLVLALIEWRKMNARIGVMRSILSQQGLHHEEAPA